MAKSKLSTPAWTLEGYDSEADYNKSKGIDKKKKEGKIFKIRECPKCSSDDVGLVLSNSDTEEESNTGRDWKCNKCKWQGSDVNVKELNEDELMKYLDEKNEEVA